MVYHNDNQKAGFPLLSSRNYRAAFTLAEILITLGVIGVVAALTLPSLITKYQEKQLVTSYLRVYSLLENAYRHVQAEYGTFENWSGAVITINGGDGKPDTSLSQRKNLYEYMIKPYIQVNEAFLPADWNWDGKTNCWPKSSSNLGGEPYSSNYNGELTHKPAVSLKSGECIVLAYANGDFVVDLNSKKGPNVLGKDQFVFNFDPLKPERIKPGFYQRWWTDISEYCNASKGVNSWHNGISCGFWIVRHHNMDYLHLPYEEVRAQWQKEGGDW